MSPYAMGDLLHSELRLLCLGQLEYACKAEDTPKLEAGHGEAMRPELPVSFGALGRTQHSFGGSFSAGSKPIFASKYAFFLAFFKIYKKIIFSRANLANFC